MCDSGCLLEEKLPEREGKSWKLPELSGEAAMLRPRQKRRGATGAHRQLVV